MRARDLETVSDVLFWSTLALVAATTAWTIWRTRGKLSLAVLLPLAWIALIPIPVILRPITKSEVFVDGFVGSARDSMYVAIAIANVAFAAYQVFLWSPWYRRLERFAVRVMAPAGIREHTSGDRLAQRWLLGLTIVATAIAAVHLALMPRIPVFDLLTGFTNPLQPNYDRELSLKLLQVPSIVRYIFQWDKQAVFPILFAAAILMRSRKLTVFIGVFGFFYAVSSLEKFPSLIFIAAPFIAVAVRDRRPLWAPIVIGGVALGFLGPLAVNQGPLISTSVHQALNIPPAASSVPASYDPNAAATAGCTTSSSEVLRFDASQLLASLANITLRRTGAVPAEVTYGWFAYFPAQHPYLKGSGWEPWKVLSSGYRNPSNLVGLWMYCGHTVTLPSVSAYASAIADGWGEFGMLGVLIACIAVVLAGVVFELLGAFRGNPLVLSSYAVTLLLFSTLPPRASVLASVFSSGMWLIPVICLLVVLSERIRGQRERVLAFEPAPS